MGIDCTSKCARSNIKEERRQEALTDRRSGAVEESKVSQLKISAGRLVGRSVRSGAVEGSRAVECIGWETGGSRLHACGKSGDAVARRKQGRSDEGIG